MTHEERVFHHMYETNEGIAEQSERIASLEELALDMWGFAERAGDGTDGRLAERLRGLGLEVGQPWPTR